MERQRSRSSSRSPSPKRQRIKSPPSKYLDLTHPDIRNVYELIQKEYLSPEDRLNLRLLSKSLEKSVVVDKQKDLNMKKKNLIMNDLRELSNELEELWTINRKLWRLIPRNSNVKKYYELNFSKIDELKEKIKRKMNILYEIDTVWNRSDFELIHHINFLLETHL